MKRASPTSSDGKNLRNERFRTDVRRKQSARIEKGGSYVWVANGCGCGCGAPGSCAAHGDDCGRQNVPQGRTPRSVDRVRNGRPACLHRMMRAHFSDGADVQGLVTGVDVV